MTIILLVRHGQTEWNRVERFRGRVDLELNSNGLRQAEKTAARIRNHWKPAAVFASPLLRAMQTARAIAAQTDLIVQPVPELIDIHYGAWQGLTPEETRLRWPSELETWYRQPQDAVIPDGETLIEVQRRAMDAVALAVKAYPTETIVMVSHTVVNRLILLGCLGVGIEHFWQIQQEPCAVNVIEAKGREFSLVSVNDTCHLEE